MWWFPVVTVAQTRQRFSGKQRICWNSSLWYIHSAECLWNSFCLFATNTVLNRVPANICPGCWVMSWWRIVRMWLRTAQGYPWLFIEEIQLWFIFLCLSSLAWEGPIAPLTAPGCWPGAGCASGVKYLRLSSHRTLWLGWFGSTLAVGIGDVCRMTRKYSEFMVTLKLYHLGPFIRKLWSVGDRENST